jgi:hypothetical protein
MDFAAGVYLFEAPPLLGYCLRWSSNFALVGYGSGQIQSVKLLQNMVSNRAQQQPPTPSLPLTVFIYCTLTQGRGKEVNKREG